MTADEYLNEVLASQALGDDSDEVKTLQKHRGEVEKLNHAMCVWAFSELKIRITREDTENSGHERRCGSC